MMNNAGTWPYIVKRGDILRDEKGTNRVVRSVTLGKNGLPIFVSFAIRRCSWTRRPTTTLSYVDLKQRGFVPTGLSVKRWTVLDQNLDACIKNPDNRVLFCWDVVGVMP